MRTLSPPPTPLPLPSIPRTRHHSQITLHALPYKILVLNVLFFFITLIRASLISRSARKITMYVYEDFILSF
jgi:hypothetical protein